MTICRCLLQTHRAHQAGVHGESAALPVHQARIQAIGDIYAKPGRGGGNET